MPRPMLARHCCARARVVRVVRETRCDGRSTALLGRRPERTGSPRTVALRGSAGPFADYRGVRMAPLREPDAVEWLLLNVPDGWTAVHIDGTAWGVTMTARAGGRSFSFSAERLGARDRVSANLWITSEGPKLKPCEVSVERVLDFVDALANRCEDNKESDEGGGYERSR